MGCKCSCGEVGTLYFPCSGAADVGELSDRVARRLQRDGKGKMYCLAGVGGHIEDMLLNVQAAGKILAIDAAIPPLSVSGVDFIGFSCRQAGGADSHRDFGRFSAAGT